MHNSLLRDEVLVLREGLRLVLTLLGEGDLREAVNGLRYSIGFIDERAGLTAGDLSDDETDAAIARIQATYDA